MIIFLHDIGKNSIYQVVVDKKDQISILLDEKDNIILIFNQTILSPIFSFEFYGIKNGSVILKYKIQKNDLTEEMRLLNNENNLNEYKFFRTICVADNLMIRIESNTKFFQKLINEIKEHDYFENRTDNECELKIDFSTNGPSTKALPVCWN